MSYADIVGLGTPEAAWQGWGGLSSLPRVTAADLVPAGSRVVAVAPHPDDEILGMGGLLAELSQRHHELLLLAVTDGTASHPGSERWTPDRLAVQRPRETLEALRVMGIDAEVLRLGLPDGQVEDFEELLVRHLTETISPGDVIIATWRGDAHPDHEAVGRAAAAAAAARGARLLEIPVWTWHWAEPGDSRVPWSRAVALPLGSGRHGLKRAAVAAYASQLGADHALELGSVLPEPVLERLLRSYEVFFT